MGVEVSPSGLYVKSGSDFEPVEVPLYSTSNYFSVTADEAGNVALYTKTETSSGPRFESVGGGRLPQNARAALGIYMIASNGKPQLYFYDDDWSKFPSQSYRLINISPVVINSKVGDAVLQLKPFESDVVKVKLTSRLPTVKIITVYKDGNEEWQPIYNKRTALLPNWRLTGLAVVTKGALAEAMGLVAPSVAGDHSGGLAQSTVPMKASLRYFSIKDTDTDARRGTSNNTFSSPPPPGG
jgi:hypothetical protein